MSARRIALVVVSSVILLPILAYAFVAGYLASKSPPGYLRNLFLEERAFEISVDLTVDGERLTINRKINCIPYLGEKGLEFYRWWQPELARFGERLKSGGAVMLLTSERLCGLARLEDGEDSRRIPVPEDHIPLIGWVDDASHPRFIELYASRDYYSRPNARVRFHGLTARAIRYDFSYPDEDEFEWFYGGSWSPEYPRRKSHAFYVYPIPEEKWSSEKVVASYVKSIDQPEILPKDVSLALGKFFILIDRSWFFSGRGALPGPSPNGEYNQRYPNREMGPVLPLFRRGDHYEIRSMEQGYIRYDFSAPMGSRGGAGPVITLSVRGRVLRTDVSQRPRFYDSSTKTVYLVDRTSISVPNWLSPSAVKR